VKRKPSYEVTVARYADRVDGVHPLAPSWSHPIETYRIRDRGYLDQCLARHTALALYRCKHGFLGPSWTRVWEL